MTNREKLVATLVQHGPRLCDDCAAELAEFTARQTAYAEATKAAAHGQITRQRTVCGTCGKTKICSVLTDSVDEPVDTVPTFAELVEAPPEKLWYWEGHVQSSLVAWLKQQGWSIVSTADTASKERGVDVIAQTMGGLELCVSVKGYPENSPSVQAGHWFAGAVFDLVRYRNRSCNRDLAIALPDGFTRYLNLAPQVSWLRETMPFRIYWVSEDGSVRWE